MICSSIAEHIIIQTFCEIIFMLVAQAGPHFKYAVQQRLTLHPLFGYGYFLARGKSTKHYRSRVFN